MKKTLTFLLALALLLGAFGGAAAQDKKLLRVVLIGNYIYDDNINGITGETQVGMHQIEEWFEADYPGINLDIITMGWDDYQKKTQTMIMGNEADIFIAPGIALMGDIVEDLTPYIQRDGFDTSVFLKGSLDGWKAQGEFDDAPKQYGWPFQGDCRMIMFDKEIFDQWGVEYLPEYPTWDEILEKATKMTGKNPVTGLDNYGTTASGADMIVQIAEALGGQWGSGVKLSELTFDWNSEYFVKASELMLKLYALGMTGGSTNFGQPDNVQAISLRAPTGGWISVVERGLQDKYGVSLMPVNPERGTSGMFAGGPLVISKYSTVKDEAWEFLKFAVSERVQQFIFENVFGEALPVLSTAYNWEYFQEANTARLLKAMEDATVPRWVYRAEASYKGSIDAAASAILNGADIQATWDAAVEEANNHRMELE